MKNLTEYIGSQFGNPRGIIGKICCICNAVIKGIDISEDMKKVLQKEINWSDTKKGFKFFSKEDYISDGKKAGFSDVVIEEIIKGKSYLIKYIK
jgi:hypothetical protein